jgi:hypothetical protein
MSAFMNEKSLKKRRLGDLAMQGYYISIIGLCVAFLAVYYLYRPVSAETLSAGRYVTWDDLAWFDRLLTIGHYIAFVVIAGELVAFRQGRLEKKDWRQLVEDFKKIRDELEQTKTQLKSGAKNMDTLTETKDSSGGQ